MILVVFLKMNCSFIGNLYEFLTKAGVFWVRDEVVLSSFNVLHLIGDEILSS